MLFNGQQQKSMQQIDKHIMEKIFFWIRQESIKFRINAKRQPEALALMRSTDLKNACVLTYNSDSQDQKYISLKEEEYEKFQINQYAINDIVYVDNKVQNEKFLEFIVHFYSYNSYVLNSRFSLYSYSNLLKEFGFRYRSFNDFLENEMALCNEVTKHGVQACTRQQRQLIESLFLDRELSVRQDLELDKIWIDQFARIIFNNNLDQNKFYLNSFMIDQILNEGQDMKELFIDIFNHIYDSENNILKNNFRREYYFPDQEEVGVHVITFFFFLRYPHYDKEFYSDCLVRLDVNIKDNECKAEIYANGNNYNKERDNQFFLHKINQIYSQFPFQVKKFRHVTLQGMPQNQLFTGHIYPMCLLLLQTIYGVLLNPTSFQQVNNQKIMIQYIFYLRFFTPFWVHELADKYITFKYQFPPSQYHLNQQARRKPKQIQQNTLENYSQQVFDQQQHLLEQQQIYEKEIEYAEEEEQEQEEEEDQNELSLSYQYQMSHERVLQMKEMYQQSYLQRQQNSVGVPYVALNVQTEQQQQKLNQMDTFFNKNDLTVAQQIIEEDEEEKAQSIDSDLIQEMMEDHDNAVKEYSQFEEQQNDLQSIKGNQSENDIMGLPETPKNTFMNFGASTEVKGSRSHFEF